MIPYEESINCIDMKKYFIIQPMFTWWNTKKLKYNLLKKENQFLKTLFTQVKIKLNNG